MHRVAGGSRRPGRNRAGFGNAFFQNLAVSCFTIVEDGANVFWFVELALCRVDTNLTEQIGHAEGACFIGDDRHYARPQRGIFEQIAHHSDQCHRGRHFFAVSVQRKLRISLDGGYGE